MSIRRRALGRTGIEVGEVALGCEGFEGKSYDECEPILDAAFAAGVNMIDVYSSNPELRSNLGRYLTRLPRESYVIEGHLCSVWDDGQYRRSREIDEVVPAFESLLERMRLDYVDVGMIHYVDDMEDFNTVFEGPVIEYALARKSAGRIRHLGLSTHNPVIGQAALATGVIDVILFSINPAYDMVAPTEDVNALFEKDTFAGASWQVRPERERFYQACASAGVALTVMKTFAGGMLLSPERSPLGVALTVPQAIRYALDRPAVSAVMLGAHSADEITAAAGYSSAAPSELDYVDALAHASAGSMDGRCVYCGHCAPCTVGINIAAVNKLFDLAKNHDEVPETVRDHYAALDHHAGACVGCGRCEGNCPFGVSVVERMRLAAELFGC